MRSESVLCEVTVVVAMIGCSSCVYGMTGGVEVGNVVVFQSQPCTTTPGYSTLINSNTSLPSVAHHFSSTCTCTVGYTTSNALFLVDHSSISLPVSQAARLGLRVHNPLLPFVNSPYPATTARPIPPNWLDIYHDYAEKPPSLQLAFENIKTMVSMLNAVVEVGCSPLATLVLGLPGNF